MRKLRENRHNRVYHLISRIARRAFYLDADERDTYHKGLTLGHSDAGAEAGGVMFDGMQLKDDFGETLKSYPPPKGE